MKRFYEIVFATTGLIVLFPLLVVATLMTYIVYGRPVFFKQTRAGLNGKEFNIYKYRTMHDKRDEKGILLSDKNRLTKFGRIMRSTSLDELPTLWNVATGDMSIVGPRPLLMEYLPLYSDEQAERLKVKPGITGLAQISGRNAITWDEKFALDVKYVESQSFTLDMIIIIKTFGKVFSMNGINHNKEETMPIFKGNKKN